MALQRRSPRVISDPSKRRAAVALILRGLEDDIALLFIKRALDPRDPWSGQMAFPGGRMSANDSSIRAAAVREVSEEVGLDLDRQGCCLGRLDDLVAAARGRPIPLVVTPFVFWLSGLAEQVSLADASSSEVATTHWFGTKTLADPQMRSTWEYRDAQISFQLPCIRLEGQVIWGLTHSMLRSFLDLIYQGDDQQP